PPTDGFRSLTQTPSSLFSRIEYFRGYCGSLHGCRLLAGNPALPTDTSAARRYIQMPRVVALPGNDQSVKLRTVREYLLRPRLISTQLLQLHQTALESLHDGLRAILNV